jgi:DnaJ-class molecular chaperone
MFEVYPPLYARCPRCRGNRYVTAIVEMGNGFSPTRTEDFACPPCHGTGETDMERIMEMAQADNEEFDECR